MMGRGITVRNARWRWWSAAARFAATPSTGKRVSALTVIQHRSRSLAWRRVSFDIVDGEIPALARPGELVRVSADNIGGGEIEGILVEAYDAGNGRAHIVLIADDDEAERAFPDACS